VDGRNAPSRLPDSLSIDIVDGDTIRSGGVVYRLVGFNTPESGLNAGCEKERMLAAKATQRLRQLLGGWKSSA
jgi:endonuclease YncB( thermonuclease family)